MDPISMKPEYYLIRNENNNYHKNVERARSTFPYSAVR
jgi:hypothetical protein